MPTHDYVFFKFCFWEAWIPKRVLRHDPWWQMSGGGSASRAWGLPQNCSSSGLCLESLLKPVVNMLIQELVRMLGSGGGLSSLLSGLQSRSPNHTNAQKERKPKKKKQKKQSVKAAPQTASVRSVPDPASSAQPAKKVTEDSGWKNSDSPKAEGRMAIAAWRLECLFSCL